MCQVSTITSISMLEFCHSLQNAVRLLKTVRDWLNVSGQLADPHLMCGEPQCQCSNRMHCITIKEILNPKILWKGDRIRCMKSNEDAFSYGYGRHILTLTFRHNMCLTLHVNG